MEDVNLSKWMLCRMKRRPLSDLFVLSAEPPRRRCIAFIAIAGVATLPNGQDRTALLRPGGHPRLRRGSTVFRGDAPIVDAPPRP
jgi:hypothetical protein